ncbi:MAG: anti-anti-sigma factor [Luteibaculaceae bacterium]|jgi:anti-anti-sigma factor
MKKNLLVTASVIVLSSLNISATPEVIKSSFEKTEISVEDLNNLTSITSALSSDGKELTISIQGRFDFSVLQEFRNAYESSLSGVEVILIDMSSCTYMDEDGLAMFSQLRESAGGDASQIFILNCSADVLEVFTKSGFDQYFTMH